ncbi:MAG: hypothetical protein QNJ47_04815 [Nostocaceae cyanobacterium]|nr:hypothetical protein [Nostocaceae cyanobacterium]
MQFILGKIGNVISCTILNKHGETGFMNEKLRVLEVNIRIGTRFLTQVQDVCNLLWKRD